MSMTHETLTCAESIAPERLSALRDETLEPVEAQRLREHVATCAACQARMSDYDALATALRQRRELEPGERIISGVRARLATRSASPRRRLRPSRRLWAGLATLAPVAAVILLFVYVFSGLAGRGRPATGLTPTVGAPTPIATNQYGKPIYPTATPARVTLPPFTPSVSAETAWGTLAPVATFQTPNVANTRFDLGTLSPDATTLAGTEMPVSATPDAGGIPRVDLITYDIASHLYSRVGPHWQGYIGPAGGATAIDSRYIIYSYNDGHGQTCGVCHNSAWAYDRQSGASWQVDPKAGELSEVGSGDHVAIETVEMQIWVADIATHHVAQALPQSEQENADIRLMGFNWPYLIYTRLPAASPGQPTATTLRIRNMQTGSTIILTPPLEQTLAEQNGPGSGSNVNWATIVGDTLYFTSSTSVSGVDTRGVTVNTSYGSLFRVSHMLSGAGQPESLARWQSANTNHVSALAANARLILLDSGYVWDQQENRLVRLNSQTSASLSGGYLMTQQAWSGGNPQAPIYQGAIYDTTTLPVHG
jgi:anti-sigma factor RsiW